MLDDAACVLGVSPLLFVFILFKPENMKSAAASNFLSLWKSVLLSFQDILLTEILFFFPGHSWILSSCQLTRKL